MSQIAAIQSAQTVAALRAAVTNETSLAVACEDRLAKYFISLRERLLTAVLPQPLIRWALERAAPGSYGFAIARTRCFDDALLSEAADGIQQVVILGAGYDSRAIRFANELKGVRVFEVDHPGTQARKMSILLRSNIEVPKNIQYVPVDFNRDALEAELVKKGFSRSRRTLFLWEGVSYYLQKPVVAGVLRFAESCAPGSSIVLDYALRTFVEGDTSTYGGEVDRQLAAQDRRALRVRSEPARDAALPRRMRLEARLRHEPRGHRSPLPRSQGWGHPAPYAGARPHRARAQRQIAV